MRFLKGNAFKVHKEILKSENPDLIIDSINDIETAKDVIRLLVSDRNRLCNKIAIVNFK